MAQQLNRLAAENKRLRMQFGSAAKQVRELGEFLQIMLSLSPFGICIIQDDQLIFTNKAFSEMVGFSPKALRELSPWNMILEEDREHVRKSVRTMLKGQAESSFMFRVLTHEDKIKWILGSVAFIHMNEKRAVLGNFVDLTEGRVMQLAYNDTLTGLPNRKLMMDRLEQAIVTGKRRNSRLALLFIDLDGFKDVNDRYGHEVGDKLLIEIARGLKEVVRRDNDTISRIGGDEFLILLTDILYPDHVDVIIRHLFEKFAAAVSIPGTDLRLTVTFSVGIAVYPDHGDNSDTLIRHADEAMYQIKKRPGKNGFYYFNR
jgi:diguanylate cyclase (GGDEF)-like protein/PAS domain S-box-containing protein